MNRRAIFGRPCRDDLIEASRSPSVSPLPHTLRAAHIPDVITTPSGVQFLCLNID